MLPITNSHLSPWKKESQFCVGMRSKMETRNKSNEQRKQWICGKERRAWAHDNVLFSNAHTHTLTISQRIWQESSLPSLHAWPWPTVDLSLPRHPLSLPSMPASIAVPPYCDIGCSARSAKANRKNCGRLRGAWMLRIRDLAKCRFTIFEEKANISDPKRQVTRHFCENFREERFSPLSKHQPTSLANWKNTRSNLISKLPEKKSFSKDIFDHLVMRELWRYDDELLINIV